MYVIGLAICADLCTVYPLPLYLIDRAKVGVLT